MSRSVGASLSSLLLAIARRCHRRADGTTRARGRRRTSGRTVAATRLHWLPLDLYSRVMAFTRAGLALVLALPLATALVARSAETQRPRTPSYASRIAGIRQQRVAELKADDGWLTVTGLFWLKPGVNVAGSAPGSDILLPAKAPARLGVFDLTGGHVTFRADPAAKVTIGSKPAGAAAIEAPTDDPEALAAGDLRMFVIEREDRFAVRMRDLKSTARTGFTGLRFYP